MKTDNENNPISTIQMRRRLRKRAIDACVAWRNADLTETDGDNLGDPGGGIWEAMEEALDDLIAFEENNHEH